MASPTVPRKINVPGAMWLKQPERIMAYQEQAIKSVSVTGTQLPFISEIEWVSFKNIKVTGWKILQGPFGH